MHKLGNLCILNVTQNSGVSNSSFRDKKAKLFDEPMQRGLAVGLSAFALDKVDVWNLDALQTRHALLVQYLADRWGFGIEWTAWQGAGGNSHNDDDEDGDAVDHANTEGSNYSVPSPATQGRSFAPSCLFKNVHNMQELQPSWVVSQVFV